MVISTIFKCVKIGNSSKPSSILFKNTCSSSFLSRQIKCFSSSFYVLEDLQSNPSNKSYASTASTNDNFHFPVDRIRNIGIIAHIDAGKTTTTERMLFYSGYTQRIGNVDDGSTVTDYLPQERERGITIVSACIPLGWKHHKINLIDTPGHVDFTMEVERSVRVLDGGVVILDGVAGVEAQTETVWKQANRNNLPRIIFINKMDREGSSVSKCLWAMKRKLGSSWGQPLVTQWPVNLDGTGKMYGPGSGGPGLRAIVDLLDMKILDFTKHQSGDITQKFDFEAFRTEALLNSSHPDEEESEFDHLKSHCFRAREELVSKLSDLDDIILEKLIQVEEDHLRISSQELKAALRRCTLEGKAVPVLCGASYRNMGVQPLLDAVLDYLPSPLDRPIVNALETTKNKSFPVSIKDKSMSALAFKIVNDVKRGPLVFVRVYSGTLESKSTLVNTTRHSATERATKILQMYADDYEELDSVSAGNIVALSGLKETKTGDTLLNKRPVDPRGTFVLDSIHVPAPVFQCSIIPNSKSDEEKLEKFLPFLEREDPSLQIKVDQETGQTILAGMGELHLEVTLDRLKRNQKIHLSQGKVSVAYKESLALEAGELIHETFTYDKEILGQRSFAELSATVSRVNPLAVESEKDGKVVHLNVPNVDQGGGNVIDFSQFEMVNHQNGPQGAASTMDFNQQEKRKKSISHPHENNRNKPDPYVQKAVIEGIQSALSAGPILGMPVTNLKVSVLSLRTSHDATSATSIQAAAFHVMNQLLSQSNKSHGKIILLEPMMNLTITVPEKYIGPVTKDITSNRKGHVLELESDDKESSDIDYNHTTFASSSLSSGETKHHIHGVAPLRELLGFSTHLRSITKGSAEFSLELNGYGPVSNERQSIILEESNSLF